MNEKCHTHPIQTTLGIQRFLCGVEEEPKRFCFSNKTYVEEDEVPVRDDGKQLRASLVLLKQ